MIPRQTLSSFVNTISIRQPDSSVPVRPQLMVVKSALFLQMAVEHVVKKSKKIDSHFKHSEQEGRYLKQCQKSCNVPQHALIQDVETRWNSTYLMLARLSEQRKAIILYILERRGIENLSKQEWESVEHWLMCKNHSMMRHSRYALMMRAFLSRFPLSQCWNLTLWIQRCAFSVREIWTQILKEHFFGPEIIMI